MTTIGLILAVVGGIGSIICWIMVLIQLFKNEGVGLGILGIFCGIYTYIWGWIKSKELGLSKVMLGWTGGIILGIIGQVLTGVGVATNPEFQRGLDDARTRIEMNQPTGMPVPTPP